MQNQKSKEEENKGSINEATKNELGRRMAPAKSWSRTRFSYYLRSAVEAWTEKSLYTR